MKRILVSTWLATTLAVAPQAVAADPSAGAVIVKQRCQMCHVTERDEAATLGPNLYGLAGRQAGSTSYPGYSQALKAAKFTWTRELLDRFLQDPAKLVPGTRMATKLPDAAARADVVAYLLSRK